MKIAMMVRAFLETPVPNNIAYSPASVAKPIAEGLAALGHSVTFFGPEGTKLATNIATGNLRPLFRTQSDLEDAVSTTDLFSDYLFGLYDTKMAKEMLLRARAGEFDCVVFNHYESVLPIASLFPDVNILYILHDYMDEARRRVIEMHASPNQHFISISNSQRRDAPDLNYAATIYNGIDLDAFSFEENAEDYLMYSGRITPTKGVKEAVQVAVQTNRRLLIAGSLAKVDSWYFDEHVKPFLNDKILFLGMLDKEQLIKYYKKAAAVLMPIQWQEPFGLSMAEANACGTPVIAFRRGSVPEVVVDKKTGFIVDNSAEMIMAIAKLDQIKRRDCHEHAKKHFSQKLMIKNYENVIRGIVEKNDTPLKKRRIILKKNISQNINKISRKLAPAIRSDVKKLKK